MNADESRVGGDDPGPTTEATTLGLMSTSKIRDLHRERLAVVYVRQSSPQQVLENRESRERQYALAQFAQRLGWSADRVVTIDEDQGQSGRTADARTGFQRMMTEVSLNHVGMILGLELSRLSRCNKDWHQLIDVCGIFHSLLCDQDGVYDPLDSNDRLLLGMKGAMSEFELVTLRNRLLRGSRNKAERGELFPAVPVGYFKTSTGDVIQEPDEQARGMIRLVFEKFDELGSAYAIYRYLTVNNLQLGFRRLRGGRIGDLDWISASATRILSILRHPIYAGAYAYGLHRSGTKNPATGRVEGGKWFVPPEDLRVLLLDRLPAYISWEQYLANQHRLQQNRSFHDVRGVPRRGDALLSGLVVCGKCDHHMGTKHPGDKKPSYHCGEYWRSGLDEPCGRITAAPLDELVAREVLRALEPAALELSVRAIDNIEGFVPPRRRNAFTAGCIGDVVRRLGLTGELFRDDMLGDNEWWIPDLARKLGVIAVKVHYWVKRGWIHHRRTPTGKHVIVWADQDELRRLCQLAGKKSSWFAAKHPDLVVPKNRSAK
ncbi:MAG: recombinase family protein [Pirellulaceae bacterium]